MRQRTPASCKTLACSPARNLVGRLCSTEQPTDYSIDSLSSRALPLAVPPFLMAADLPDDAWGVCADSLLPHEMCCLARVSQGLKRAITSCRAYRYLRPFTLTGHKGAVMSVAVAPGGSIVSGSADGWLKEWTVAGTQATCQDIVQQRARKIICAAALPGGRVVSGNENTQLMLADKAAVPVNRRFPDTHGRSLYGVAVRQDGSVVTVGLNDGDSWEGGDNGKPSLKVWDVAEGRCRRSINLHAVPTCVAVLPDNRVVMGSSFVHVFVFDFTTNTLHYLRGSAAGIATHTQRVASMALRACRTNELCRPPTTERSKCGLSLGPAGGNASTLYGATGAACCAWRPCRAIASCRGRATKRSGCGTLLKAGDTASRR